MNRRLGRCLTLEPRLTPVTTLLTNEHTDLNIGYSAGSWATAARESDSDPPVYFPADPVPAVGPPSVVLYAHPDARVAQSADPAMAFVGVAAGQTYWRLPQQQNPGLLYMGWSGYDTSGLSSYNPAAESKGRVTASARWMRVQLVAVDGPGHFSVWQDTVSGPVAWMASHNDGVANADANGLDTTDGISGDDAVWIPQGGHLHFNWGFTAAGRYRVTFRASALAATGPVVSPEFSYVFSVENVGRLQFAAAATIASESAGAATVTVTRVGGSDGGVRVDYATVAGGSATAGVDYTPVAGTLTFDDGEVTKTFAVPIAADVEVEGDETVRLELSNFRPVEKPAGLPGNPPLAGDPVAATLTIQDAGGPADPPPVVDQVTVNAGAAQRSRVTRLDVRFSEVVTLAAGAFTVRRLADNATADVTVTTAVENGQTVATLTFGGPATEAGSLADGRWRLTVTAAAVTGSVGQPLPADATGEFHRLFGDADGNAAVTFADFLAFRVAFGTSGPSPFDIDGNGQVAFADFLAFRARFGTLLP